MAATYDDTSLSFSRMTILSVSMFLSCDGDPESYDLMVFFKPSRVVLSIKLSLSMFYSIVVMCFELSFICWVRFLFTKELVSISFCYYTSNALLCCLWSRLVSNAWASCPILVFCCSLIWVSYMIFRSLSSMVFIAFKPMFLAEELCVLLSFLMGMWEFVLASLPVVKLTFELRFLVLDGDPFGLLCNVLLSSTGLISLAVCLLNLPSAYRFLTSSKLVLYLAFWSSLYARPLVVFDIYFKSPIKLSI